MLLFEIKLYMLSPLNGLTPTSIVRKKVIWTQIQLGFFIFRLSWSIKDNHSDCGVTNAVRTDSEP